MDKEQGYEQKLLIAPSTSDQPSMPLASTEIAAEMRIRGTVQGVGFRPMVYQLARLQNLRGEVYNDAAGVVIRVAGTADQIHQLADRLHHHAPPLAHIESISQKAIAPETIFQPQFEITQSRRGQSRTQIAPDTATCPQCLAEIRNPLSRFYRYPFTNCTHCGPRLSIVRAIPYDRGNTSMTAFALCPNCQAGYDNPLNRRFHAQPVACPRCGPTVWLSTNEGPVGETERCSTSAIPSVTALDDLDAVCTLLQQGEIVAIQGIGGIHMACDATNDSAVHQLRQRKQRYHKPFALMVRDLAVIAPYCEVSDAEKTLLESPAAPIVLLHRRSAPPTSPQLSPALAPNLSSLGVMLPYTPLHHLILAQMDRPIVLTSGNLSDEPQCIDPITAKDKLGGIATYFLFHNREIVNRVDDSVVRVVAGQRQTLRRARGYAPAPIPLPLGFEDAPPVLAMGGELKSTFCLGQRGEAVLSQHLGDLENAAAFAAYQETLTRYQRLFEHQPVAIATDLHPNYLSTQLGQRLAQAQGLPCTGIQHHHAHIAACLVEQRVPLGGQPVLGIALDGLGYGTDGTLWGGEFLVTDYLTSQRVAHLEPMAMLGGAQAIRQPWRNTYAHLMAALGWEAIAETFGDLDLIQFLATQPRPILDRMLVTQQYAPLATSAGRLFDAVAAAVGCCRETASYEGQGAMELEALVMPEELNEEPYAFAVVDQGPIPVLSAAPLWSALLKDLQQGVSPSKIAARFHAGFADAIATLAVTLTDQYHLSQVVLSGGVFQNRILLEAISASLQQRELIVWTPHQVPPNDGGLSLGQVAIASARMLQENREKSPNICLQNP